MPEDIQFVRSARLGTRWNPRPRHEPALKPFQKRLAGFERDQRLFRPHFHLLHAPGVSTRIAETEERAAVALVEDNDLAGFNPPAEQFLSGGIGVRDHQLQAAHRTWLQLLSVSADPILNIVSQTTPGLDFPP
ncbi:hypothetical protein [Arthrobacter sp. H14]|uniref:hypothetical protein n=1 Tax=Arthrobacter sp. H14 TaxID=1312959 RepID=UPI00047E2C03|nr:hypothetical protein [Arthrobacter sp. H14]